MGYQDAAAPANLPPKIDSPPRPSFDEKSPPCTQQVVTAR
jgi:hypothetical protein